MGFFNDIANRNAARNAAPVNFIQPTGDLVKRLQQRDMAGSAAASSFDKMADLVKDGYKVMATGNIDFTAIPEGTALTVIRMDPAMLDAPNFELHVKQQLMPIAKRHFTEDHLIQVEDDFVQPEMNGMSVSFVLRAEGVWMVIAFPIEGL